MDFDSLIRTAEAIGLDAVAITDHDTMEGAVEFQRLASSKELALQIIPGEEKTLSDGSHLIGLFLRKQIESNDLQAAIAEIEDQGGFCLLRSEERRVGKECR